MKEPNRFIVNNINSMFLMSHRFIKRVLRYCILNWLCTSK